MLPTVNKDANYFYHRTLLHNSPARNVSHLLNDVHVSTACARACTTLCFLFSVNAHRNIVFPSAAIDLFLSLKSLGPFESTSDGQQLISDTVTILDSESLYIPNLQMAIEDNGYHFWTGNSSDRRPNDMGQKVADEKARYDDLHLYNGQVSCTFNRMSIFMTEFIVRDTKKHSQMVLIDAFFHLL